MGKSVLTVVTGIGREMHVVFGHFLTLRLKSFGKRHSYGFRKFSGAFHMDRDVVRRDVVYIGGDDKESKMGISAVVWILGRAGVDCGEVLSLIYRSPIPMRTYRE